MNENSISVLKNIIARTYKNADPSRKTCLVVEGGAMRGIVVGGMMVGLEKLGLQSAFDHIYGASAGALSAVYFASNQAQEGVHVYYKHINNRHFINPARFFTRNREPVISLEYLVDHVYTKKVPVNFDTILSTPDRFKITATTVHDGTRHTLSQFTTAQEVRDALKCTARVPVLAGDPFIFRGTEYWDALLSEPIPFYAAVEDGCQDILILLARSPHDMLQNTVFDYYLAHHISKKSPLHAKQYLNSEKRRYQILAEEIYSAEQNGIHTALISPPKDTPSLSFFEKNASRLKEAAEKGERAVFETFSPFLN